MTICKNDWFSHQADFFFYTSAGKFNVYPTISSYFPVLSFYWSDLQPNTQRHQMSIGRCSFEMCLHSLWNENLNYSCFREKGLGTFLWRYCLIEKPREWPLCWQIAHENWVLFSSGQLEWFPSSLAMCAPSGRLSYQMMPWCRRFAACVNWIDVSLHCPTYQTNNTRSWRAENTSQEQDWYDLLGWRLDMGHLSSSWIPPSSLFHLYSLDWYLSQLLSFWIPLGFLFWAYQGLLCLLTSVLFKVWEVVQCTVAFLQNENAKREFRD